MQESLNVVSLPSNITDHVIGESAVGKVRSMSRQPTISY